MTKTIFTDGACSGNPGPGGWAWAIEDGAYKSGAEKQTTNQRMELMAVLDALQSNDGPLEIVSDSTYVVNCFKDKWYAGWLKRGWVNSKKQPVANRDIWEPLINNYLARKDVSFRWVKGHSGNAMNDLVDRLAVEAGRNGRGTQGNAATETSSPSPSTAKTSKARPQATEPRDLGYVVVFRAELTEGLDDSYEATATRMRTLALGEFGCTDFQALCQNRFEIALSYWKDEASITNWRKHAEHLLAQEKGRSDWYRSYRVDVARVARSYAWPENQG